MNTILNAKKELASTQEQLIDYLSLGDESQDLTHLFVKLKEENPVAFELLMLIYQEINTKSKIDRKRMTKVLTTIINQHHITYDKLIQHDQKINIEKEKTMLEKFLQPKVVGMFLGVWLVIVLTLTFTYTISPDVFHSLLNATKEVVKPAPVPQYNNQIQNQYPQQSQQAQQSSTRPQQPLEPINFNK